MRVFLQRVTEAEVQVDGKQVGAIGRGLLLFVGFAPDDDSAKQDWIINKCLGLRVFHDEDGKMNLSVQAVEGDVLIVSQFTLYADVAKGNRPSFVKAAPPGAAEPMYERFVAAFRKALGEKRVSTGLFGANMQVKLINDGPVSLWIER